ncbi:MAG: hypothetical protein UY53_C0012G0019 [Parcubacteria group bacterium GW2011_GWA2_50_10]|uniref:Uncharacterized protein n=1 Tax=Candidatus Yanofskybacteria bacterium GW2011_GWC1_48_11 TaxID=1619027 RepID=A0A837ILV9_9BACT|nr:MAG: hypothetical protein UY25_C0002G0173 [Candidatus Yanofskybacteria bacterium GW2011_GWC1_48_11]KKW04578.1 MAG: hypothetical protein UY38_C0001G0145 [Parcubacteria group bacterium GW2011_GWB1_49_12]KKW09164.1 MAG: hypothetical protein UY45_C0001G0050 [Parcubacteria group bacterium GW2011_GWA1_49_26]KKW13501.1 MAG: hypothetical protein UY53_C0012G0019 [Parcubacteria group bacterium GW2011_GWA2_50_10]
MTDSYYLNKTIEIVKEYARSGNARPIEDVFEAIYRKLRELGKDEDSAY